MELNGMKPLVRTMAVSYTHLDVYKRQVINWRRYFHEFPELGNREFNTCKKVEEALKSFGISTRIVAKTGVVGILKGGKPGPVVALRADMDGLPVEERNNLSFASKAKGEYNGATVPVMHACGHDSHVAMLLGAAEVLSKIKNDISGTVVFLFQPLKKVLQEQKKVVLH